MKIIALTALIGLSAASSQQAFANADLAKAKSCMACHATTTKLVGPAIKDIAAKYRGQKDAEAKLSAKVMKGGAGVWGPVSMPPNPQVSEAEAKTLVKWFLAYK